MTFRITRWERLQRVGAAVLILLLAGTGARAQSAEGGHGGHEHGDRGGRAGGDLGAPNAAAPTPVEQVDIIGVVQAIDVAAGRVTIAYDAVAARNWPPGTMPFAVENPALLTGVTVGERVRFKLVSMQITDLGPFTPRPAGKDDSHAVQSRADGHF